MYVVYVYHNLFIVQSVYTIMSIQGMKPKRDSAICGQLLANCTRKFAMEISFTSLTGLFMNTCSFYEILFDRESKTHFVQLFSYYFM